MSSHIDLYTRNGRQVVPHHLDAGKSVSLCVQYLFMGPEQCDHITAVPSLLHCLRVEQAAETAFHELIPPYSGIGVS